MTEIQNLQSEQPKAAPAVLTPGQVALFLKAKNAERPCEACGSKDWRAHSETADMASGTLGFAKLDNQDMRAVAPAVFLYCRSCGLVRTFLRSIIAEWVRDARHG